MTPPSILSTVEQLLWAGIPPSSQDGEKATAKRVTLNVTHRSAHAVRVAQDLDGDATATEVLNRGVQLYAYVRLLQARGCSLLVEPPDGGSPERLRVF